MRAKETVDTLDKLIDEILETTGTERTILCMTIDSILDKFDEWLIESQDAKDNHPCRENVSIYIAEMKDPLYCLAGLNDHYDNMNQCVVWLCSGIKKMRRKNGLSLW
ncbi:MAG: hypothetical protein D3904_06800 [Candidatus Electrothrix sp. EH2]|jgi:hypothetical protein|nr:hypothetical protein [Candidatus Electrothrix sp. EH2]